MIIAKPRIAHFAAFLTTMAFAVPAAHADGEYFQLDLSQDSSTMVGSATRGNMAAAAALSSYNGGGALALNVTRSFALPALGEQALIRVGPTARLNESNDFDLGAKVVFERFTATDFGGIFLLADYNTIQSEYLFLAEVSDARSGFSTSFAVQGDNDEFRENTLMIGYQIPDSAVRLRLGYKFESEQIVFGFSVNTF